MKKISLVIIGLILFGVVGFSGELEVTKPPVNISDSFKITDNEVTYGPIIITARATINNKKYYEALPRNQLEQCLDSDSKANCESLIEEYLASKISGQVNKENNSTPVESKKKVLEKELFYKYLI